jgi:hypothetical protein
MEDGDGARGRLGHRATALRSEVQCLQSPRFQVRLCAVLQLPLHSQIWTGSVLCQNRESANGNSLGRFTFRARSLTVSVSAASDPAPAVRQ